MSDPRPRGRVVRRVSTRRRTQRVLSGSVLWLWASSFVLTARADYPETLQQWRTGQYAACVESSEKALAQNDRQEPYWVLKLRGELELGRYSDAAKTLDAALQKAPTSLQLRWYGRDACRYTQQAERVTKLEGEMVDLLRQSPWMYSDTANQLLVGRWLLSQRADPKQVLTNVYNVLKRRDPNNVEVWIAIGDLALEKFDYKLAGEAFQQAVKLQADHPGAQFGVAQAFAPSNAEKATEAIQAALESNPNHIPCLLWLADGQIDDEEYATADKTLEQVLAINPRHPLALTYRAILAHLRNQPEAETKAREAALQHWPTNPEVDHLYGRKLAQKYRFAEGAAAQQRALQFNPLYLPAKMQLAQDLLRLGREAEGMKLAEEVYTADTYNVQAHNLVTLQERLTKFRTLEADGLLVRMETHEADIYGSRVVALLKRAHETLATKYDVQLQEPVIVEIFPKQQDFAIRTFGMPGGGGFLGVCFGTVITANSPASQGTSPACWEATLWHEYCHVITLSKTHNKMPRWLSEGISVYEEGLADPTWGQSLTPKIREMLLGDDFTPISQLSGAFLHAKSPLHLQFAYFESSLAVQFLVEKYGQGTLQKILVDLGIGIPINEALGRHTVSLAALDEDFAKYAREQAKQLAPDADWSAPELPRRATVEVIQEWLQDHPRNYAALQRLAERQIADKQWDAARKTAEELRTLYPQDAGPGNAHALLARIAKETGDVAAELTSLEALAGLTASNLECLNRLIELQIQAEDWEAARRNVQRVLAVNPLLPETHRQAATVAERLSDRELALGSYQALLLLKPLNVADIHYQIARLQRQQGDLTLARRHVLLALEETPRFRAAQKLLLEIVGEAGEGSTMSPPAATADQPPIPLVEGSRPPPPDLPDLPLADTSAVPTPKPGAKLPAAPKGVAF